MCQVHATKASILLQLLVGASLFLASSLPLFSQVGTSGSISGVVQDSTGAVVPGAVVTAINQRQNATNARLTTDGAGVFSFSPLPASVYTITVEAPSFKKFSQADITLNVNDRIGLPPIVLQVGSSTETVTVTANAVQLQTVSATRDQTINQQQVHELPVSSLTNIATGYLREVNGNPPDSPGNFNGGRTTDVTNTLDGVTFMDGGSATDNCSTCNYSQQAIAEVKVTTSASGAEFGRSAGYQVSSILKSGGSDFHGEGWWFHHNEGLGSNTALNEEEGIQKPISRGMIAGFNFGGPVWLPFGPLKKYDKLRQTMFFFVNFEWNPSTTNSVVQLTTPTTNEVNGNFAGVTNSSGQKVTVVDPLSNKVPFPGNVIPSSRQNPYGQALLALLNKQDPPNISGNPLYNAQYTLPALPVRPWDDIYRYDWNVSSKNRLSVHFLHYHFDNLSYSGSNTQGNVDWSLYHRPDGAWQIAGNLVTIVSPSLTNEFNYGYFKNFVPTQPPAAGSPYLQASGASLWNSVPVLYSGKNPAGIIPGFVFNASGSTIGDGPMFGTLGLPYVNRETIQNYGDNLTKVYGNHIIKAGALIETQLKSQTLNSDVNGTYYFTNDTANPLDTGWGYSNAFVGTFDQQTQGSNYLVGNYPYQNYEWYVQDSWKVKPNFTLNYGVRMSLMPPWHEQHNLVSGFEPQLYNPAQAVVLYQPYCSNGAKSCSGSTRVARNPITGTLEPTAFIGTEVPGVGNQFNGATPAGTAGVPDGLQNSRGVQWGPRLGFAWQPSGPNSKWVVRGGGSVSYLRAQGNEIFYQLANPPSVVEAQIYYGTLGSAGGTSLQPISQSTGIARDGHIPTIYNYSVGIQRELPKKTLLDVSYVGTIGNHLITDTPYNNVPLGSAWLPQNQDPTLAVTSSTVLGANALPANFYRQYLGYAGAGGTNQAGSLISFNANSNYNALQVTVQHRASQRLSIGANYTWSKSLGLSGYAPTSTSTTPSSNDFLILSSVNPHVDDYGPLAYDRRQYLNVDYVFNIPDGAPRGTFLDHRILREVLNGWQLSGITGYASGPPQTAFYTYTGVSQTTLNQEITGSADVEPRAILTCNPFASGPKTAQDWINLTCLHPAPIGSSGADSGIGAFPGLGYRNWDAAIMKKISFGKDGTRYAQIRFEAYNVFNHPEWSGVNLTPSFNPTTGAITNFQSNVPGQGGGILGYGALNAIRSVNGLQRYVQLGVKFYF